MKTRANEMTSFTDHFAMAEHRLENTNAQICLSRAQRSLKNKQERFESENAAENFECKFRMNVHMN